ncbi:MAG: type II CAAX endopeptidase family protein [Myxococcales bacterium]
MQGTPSAAHSAHSSTRSRRAGRRMRWVLAGLVSVWFLLMRQFGGADMYSVLGPYALAVSTVLWLLRPHAIARWLAPSTRVVVVGLLVGLAMTLATYPAYRLAAGLIPGLEQQVSALYRSASTAPLHVELAWVCVIIVAEELLWRGALLEALERKTSLAVAWSVCIGSYALAQLGTGAWVLGAIAAVCGLIWTVERKLTDSVLAPLISHLIWTPTVILLHPVM